MERLTRADAGAYWGKVVEGNEAPPCTVSVARDLWDFEVNGTHYLMRHEAVLEELRRDQSSPPEV
jgi:hypothetical protein